LFRGFSCCMVHWRRLMCVAIGGLLLVALGACQPSNATPTLQPGEVEIPFETVVLDEEATAISIEDIGTDPQVFTITTHGDIDRIRSLISPESVKKLEEIDLNTNSALVVFRGLQGCSGFGLNVARLRLRDDTLIIDVQFWQPPPNTACSDVVISPYHIIKVDKNLIALDHVQLVLQSQEVERSRH
jgi:PrcB C-terminal